MKEALNTFISLYIKIRHYKSVNHYWYFTVWSSIFTSGLGSFFEERYISEDCCSYLLEHM